MANKWSVSFVLLAVCISYACALECFVCKEKEEGNDCAKMGEEFDADAVNKTTCPEPGKNDTGHAVCGKTITAYQSIAEINNNGVIGSRYCDIVDYADTCWTNYGAKTNTSICVCSNDDLCNAAVPTHAPATVTVFAAAVVMSLVFAVSGQ